MAFNVCRLAKLGIFGGRFEAATHVHFLADVFHMGPHGLGSNIQFVPDFLVDKTSGQQVQHFPLARREII